MKPKYFCNLLAAAISTISLTGTLHAAAITWDTDGVTAGIQGGAGTWGASATNWTINDGTTRAAWDNATNASDTGLFATGTGRVTVDSMVKLNGITVNSTTSSSIGGRTLTYLFEGAGFFNFGSQQGVVDTFVSGLRSLQINNILLGSGGLRINGANASASGDVGWVTLVGDNSDLTGGIVVENGMLGVNRTVGLGANAVTLDGDAGIFGPVSIAGAATTVIDGPATLTLANAVTANGTGNMIRVWGGRTLTFSAALTGSGDISKADGGTLALTGDTSGYTGTFTNPSGTTTVSGNIGGSVVATGGTVTLGGNVAGGLGLNGAASVTVAGDVAGALNSAGTGSVALSGSVGGPLSHTGTGLVTVGGNVTGDLSLAGTGTVRVGGNLPGALTFTQGTLNLQGSHTGDLAVTGTNSGFILGSVGTLTGNVSTAYNAGQALLLSGQVVGNVAVEELVFAKLAGCAITGDLAFGLDTLSTQTTIAVTTGTVAVTGNLKVNGSATLQIDGSIPSGTPILTFANLVTDTATLADHLTVVAPPSFTDVVVTYNPTNIVVTYTAGPAPLTWDSSSTAGIQPGAGTWSATSNKNWSYDNGTSNSFWTDGSVAVFEGDLPAVNGGTIVTLNGALSVTNLTRTGLNGVRLNASTGNMLAVNGTVDVSSYLVFAAAGDNQFTGSFVKAGAGLLELNGGDSRHIFAGATLNQGTIGFWDGSGLQSETVTLNGGAIGSLSTAACALNGPVTIGGNIGIGSGTGTNLSSGAMSFGSTGTVDLGGVTRTLTIGSNVDFNGVVSNGSITKQGAGRLTLANIANSLSGPTTVNTGELRVSSAVADTGTLGTLGTGAVTVGSGATLRFFTVGSTTNGKTYANAINLNSATLIGSDGVHTLTGAVALTGANNIQVQFGTKNLILEGAISGDGSMTTSGSTLFLTADNSYSGSTTIASGTLQIGNGGTTGTLGGGAVTNNGTLAVSRSTAYSLANAISGTGSLRFYGTGASTLGGNNTFGGSTVVQGGGTLEVITVADAGGVGSLGTLSSAGNSWFGVRENSTLRITGTGTQTTSRFVWNDAGTGSGTFDVVDAGASIVFTATGGGISRNLTKKGAGALTMARLITGAEGVTVDAGSLTLGGVNTYTGATQIATGATLGLSSASSQTLSGAFTGNGSLVKSGAGILTLSSAANTFSGNISVDAGQLTLADNAKMTFAVTNSGVNQVSGTGTLSLNGDFVIDTSALSATSGSWILVNTATLTESFGVTFTMAGAGWSETADVHTLVDGPKTWTFTEATGELTLVSASGYTTWAAANAPTGSSSDDYDGDGVSNALEWVFGGDKDTNDSAKLPDVSTSGGNLLFTFVRDQDSITDDTDLVIEVGTDLATWPGSYAVPDAPELNLPGVTVVDNIDGTDTVTLSVPMSPDTEKFARIKVTITP